MQKTVGRLPRPDGVALWKIDWVAALTIGSFHLVALLACLPWFFNLASVWVMLVGVFVFGYLGINLCYHRLLTHKGLVCPKWLEHSFAVLAVCCAQDTPARWVGIHRWHHVKSDESDDPHTPLAGPFWGHVGWIFIKNDEIDRYAIYTRFAKDILRDPFYKKLETTARYPMIIVGSWLLFFLAGVVIEVLLGGSFRQAVQFGASLLIWGVFVRTVVVWHVTWSVNSLAHLYGYRNFNTSDDSRNNWFVALVTLGEGWHNNHHADARSARHGHRWFEVDLTFSVIQLLERVGLASEVVRPSKRLMDDKKIDTVDYCDARRHKRMLRFKPLNIAVCTRPTMKLLLQFTSLLLAVLLQQAAAQTTVLQDSPLGRANKNLVLLVSIDGFRNDYLDRGITPNLSALAQQGTLAKKFEPVFPTITFPNHFALITGRYPDHNGIVNNTMYDPAKTDQVFRLSDRHAIENPLWWEEGTPLWVTLNKQGKRSSTLFWVGSEAPIQGIQPNDWLKYEHALSSSERTQQLLRWLNRDDQDRADFATLYFSEVDSKGHEFGPDSPEVNASITSADQAIGELLEGLRALGLAEKTTLIVTSDHGMAHIAPDRAVDLSAYAKELESVRIQWSGPLAGFDANVTDKPILLSRLKQNPNMDCWPKEDIPAKYHFGTHRRVPQVVCLAKSGWSTIARAGQKVIPGQHGHDPSDPAMQGLFIIQGPQIKRNQLDTVRNIDVYNLLVRLLKVVGEKNDGQDTLYDLVIK